ncbi:MAG: DUF1365 domain-containing protein [Pseudomonadota bacterium]
MTPTAFYIGHVTHKRFGPTPHFLRYKIAYVLADLDRTERPGARLMSVDRPGVLSLRSKDHGDGDSDNLAGWVRAFLQERGVASPAARIELLTLPRMLGFVFNPLSVYFIYDDANALHHILYEVNNTLGERHHYLCPAQTDENDLHAPVDQSCPKEFYVSPFFDIEGRYRFRVRPPGETLALNIHYENAAGDKAMNATLNGARAPVSDKTCLAILFGLPLMTIGVAAAIGWEALKLKLKGALFRPHRPAKTPIGFTMGARSQNNLKPKEAA